MQHHHSGLPVLPGWDVFVASQPGSQGLQLCVYTHTLGHIYVCGGVYIYLPKTHPKKPQPFPQKNKNI